MRAELIKFDNTRSGKLDLSTFKRAMKQLSLALNDEEIEKLYETSDVVRSAKGHLDVLSFVKIVEEAGRRKPLPSFLMNIPEKPGSKVQSRIGMGYGMQKQGANFENWEVEKKYKKNLEALKHEIEERNKDIIIAKKEV